METRPTKINVDDISIAVKRLRASNLRILEEQKETNKLLKKMLKVMKDEERWRQITL